MTQGDAGTKGLLTAGTERPLAHGGDLDASRRRFPGAPEPWIDLSTGINPWPYPLPSIPPEAWTRLPSADAGEALLTAAAAAYGVADPACLAAAPGSQALIQMLPRLRPPGRVAIVAPTYAEHARCWALAGHDVREVADAEDASAEVLVVVNPNNPDGRVVDRSALLALAEAQAARGGWLVVDEAFADVVPGCSVADAVGPGLLVLRSFGKMYGLAGLRLGIAVAERGLAAALRDAFGPWAVAGPALTVATAALADRDWQVAMVDRLVAASAELRSLLTRHGFQVVGGTPLFCLAAHPDASALADRLAAAGILVRRFAGRPTLLRFGLPPDEAALRRLTEVIVDYRDNSSHKEIAAL